MSTKCHVAWHANHIDCSGEAGHKYTAKHGVDLSNHCQAELGQQLAATVRLRSVTADLVSSSDDEDGPSISRTNAREKCETSKAPMFSNCAAISFAEVEHLPNRTGAR